MARLVEDMIQESMSRGDFENLSGKGKPLKPEGSSNNPYIDFTTHKMNQILIDNGFAPEWILLEKEIRQEITEIRQKLRIERHKYGEELGSFEELNWHKLTSALQPQFDILNQKINKYNLVVPIMTRQIIGLQMERESRNALKNYSKELHEAWRARKPETENQSLDPAQKHATHSDNQSFIGMMFSMFK
jgi:DnaJ family protein C protein 28